jgi:hypothetical protein
VYFRRRNGWQCKQGFLWNRRGGFQGRKGLRGRLARMQVKAASPGEKNCLVKKEGLEAGH